MKLDYLSAGTPEELKEDSYLLSEGTYMLNISHLEQMISKSGNTVIRITFVVIEPDSSKDRYFKKNYIIDRHDETTLSDAGLEYARKSLRKLALAATNFKGVEDIDNLLDLKFLGTVNIKPARTDNNGTEWRAYNDLAKCAPLPESRIKPSSKVSNSSVNLKSYQPNLETDLEDDEIPF